jgi:3-dehydro-L-gulonate-6-phosphate decarboxylase
MTVVSCALSAMKASLPVARKYGGDVQVALYGEWTLPQAREWHTVGLKQAIYHRAFDAEAAGEDWTRRDLERIRSLVDLGFEVSVTGGLHPASLELFRVIPVRCLIMGRSLYDAVSRYWS